MKPTKLFYLLPVLVFLLFATCKKKLLNTTIEGYVIDYYTDEPIAGAVVGAYERVYRKEYGEDVEKRNQSNSTTTDANGFYNIKYKSFRTLLGKKSVVVYAQKDDEYFERNYYYPEKENDGGNFGEDYNIKPGRKNRIDIKLKGEHGYQIHIKNINPYDVNDKICFGTTCYFGEDVDILGSRIIINNEYYIDKGINYFTIDYIVTKNNISTPFQEKVYFQYKKIIPHEIFY